MYRRLQSNFGKTKNAMFKASEDMVKGMLVVKDVTNGTVKLPDSATSINVYIVDFEPNYTGLMSVENNISDYDTKLNAITSGDDVTLELLENGEEYATDQFVATDIVVGSYLEVNTDGKLVKKATGTSPLVATNIEYKDAGHDLLAFTVTETPERQ